jgi:hypothetical protein
MLNLLNSMETKEFKEKLASLLNQFGWDNECNMPDHIIADSVTRHLESLAETSKKNMEWHGWKGAGESEWNLAAKVRPEEKVVLARIMPKNEARVVNVVDGKFIVDGCEMVTHWMQIPKIEA